MNTSVLQTWSLLRDVSNLRVLPLPVSHWAVPSAQVPHFSRRMAPNTQTLYPSPIVPSFILSLNVTSPSLLCAKMFLFSSSPPAASAVACTERESLIDLVWIFYELQNEKCTHGGRSDYMYGLKHILLISAHLPKGWKIFLEFAHMAYLWSAFRRLLGVRS